MRKRIFTAFLLAVMATALVGICPRPARSLDAVIDAANLANSLLRYLSMIQEYKEAVEQTGLMDNQYAQLVQEYRQMLIEYRHYLYQLQGLRHKISAADWRALMAIIDSYYGKSAQSTIPAMDPQDPGYDRDLEVVLRQYGHVPRDPAAVEAEARAVGAYSEQMGEEIRRDYENFERLKDQMRMVSDNETKSEERKDLIEFYREKILNLDDESDLATLQLMASQQNTSMSQNEELIKILNQHLLNQELEAAREAARRAADRETELERLRNRKPTRVPTNTRLGDF